MSFRRLELDGPLGLRGHLPDRRVSAPPAARRDVHVGDAVQWLTSGGPRPSASFVTSLPDVSEVGVSLARWRSWFVDAAARVCDALTPDGLAIFVQTDLRHQGRWIDKSALVAEGAGRVGAELLCKKIVCRRPPGSRSSAGASFSSLLVYGRGRALDPALPDVIPDVILDPGPATWVRGVGRDACAAAVHLVQRYAPSSTVIVDPFCGEGMTLAVANALGLAAVGVERNQKRAAKARALVIAAAELAVNVRRPAPARRR